MKKHPFHRIAIMAGFLFIGSLLAGWAIDLGAQIAKKIRYPVYDAKGQLQYEVLGDEARVLPDERIHIVNLKLIFYEEGRLVTEVTAPECYFDRAKQVASATSAVCLARAEMVLTGQGYEVTWTNNIGHVKINSQVKVVFNSGATP